MERQLVLRAAAASLFLCLVNSPATGQTPAEEIARLRQILVLPDSATLTVSATPAPPTTSPVKLFIATGLDLRVQQNFLKWVDEWNRKDAKKHGSLVLVNDAASADVILARFVDREKARTGTETGLRTGVVVDPMTGAMQAVPYAGAVSYTLVPVFAYIVTQASPNRFAIIGRYVVARPAEEDKNSGKVLWDEFKDLMKKRPDQPR